MAFIKLSKSRSAPSAKKIRAYYQPDVGQVRFSLPEEAAQKMGVKKRDLVDVFLGTGSDSDLVKITKSLTEDGGYSLYAYGKTNRLLVCMSSTHFGFTRNGTDIELIKFCPSDINFTMQGKSLFMDIKPILDLLNKPKLKAA